MDVLNRRTLLGAGLAAAIMPLVSRPASAQQRLRVAFVLPGPIGDYGWALAHERGRAAVEVELSDRVQAIAVPDTSEDASAIPAVRDLAQQGYQLIFAASSGYEQQVLEVAREFPMVSFEVCGGSVRTDNVATYDLRLHEGRAVMGSIAGMMSRSGRIGYLGSYRLPQVVSSANAFLLAAQRQRPDVRMSLTFIDAWFDPPSETAAIDVLARQGADVVATETDSPAALQALERLGLLGFGQGVDLSAYAPGAQLTAIESLWGGYYVARTRALLDGTWTSAGTSLGLAEGALGIAPFSDAVPTEVAAEAGRVSAGYADGSLDVFAGPIHDQSGVLRVAEGDSLGQDELARMDWFVQGIEITQTAGAAE